MSRLPDPSWRITDREVIDYLSELVRSVESSDQDLRNRISVGSFTPEFLFISAPTYTDQIGKYWQVENLVHFKIFMSWSGLDTADTSGITVGMIRPLPVTAGHGAVNLALRVSTGITLASTDLFIPGLRTVTTDGAMIEFTNPALTAYTYNSGKIAAAGNLVLHGYYEVGT